MTPLKYFKIIDKTNHFGDEFSNLIVDAKKYLISQVEEMSSSSFYNSFLVEGDEVPFWYFIEEFEDLCAEIENALDSDTFRCFCGADEGSDCEKCFEEYILKVFPGMFLKSYIKLFGDDEKEEILKIDWNFELIRENFHFIYEILG